MKKLITILFVACSFIGKGQNYIFQNQHFFKPYLTNPALAGAQNNGNVAIIYKKQLVGFENSPNSQVLSIDYPFSKSKVGVGVNGFKDKNGFSSFTGFETTFAYHVSSDKKGSVPSTGFSFGLSATYNQYSIDGSNFKPEESDDITLTDPNKLSNAYPNANFGFNFYSSGFNLGLSAYNIIPNVSTIFTNKDDIQNAFTVFINSGVDLKLKENMVIRPNVLYRTQKNSDFQFDMMLDFKFISSPSSFFTISPVFRNYGYAAITGRQSVGVNALVSWHPFVLGYQFETPLSAMNDFSRGGNHVIFLAFKLTSKPEAIKQYKADEKKEEVTPAKSTKN
jgi:type IX secretion system PorP/SprF family membrane protein